MSLLHAPELPHLLLSLKNASGESFSLSPDKFSATVDIPVDRNILSAITTAHVAFRVWKKANDPYMNNFQYQFLKEQMELNEYKAHVEKTAEKFCHHKRRIKAQYSGVKDITVKLGYDELAAQMDYAESQKCQECAEVIQSAYFSQNMVMLYPLVSYYRSIETDAVLHKSVVTVSPVDKHNITNVLAILKKFHCEEVPAFWPNRTFKRNHYVTDGPTSQYRNKLIFWLVANHKQIFGMKAVWHFLEAGHGKGPCDGMGPMGSSLKKMARDATKRGKNISNANTFFKWAISIERTLLRFTYLDVFDYLSVLTKRINITPNLQAVVGTFSIHSVMVGQDEEHIAHRETTYPCNVCAHGGAGLACEREEARITK